MTNTNEVELLARLREFGHESFRPGQERAVRALLSGRDVLALLPTGSGKSLIYQLASQILPGVTIVVSPLIALMKDQVESMEEMGLEAGAVNSSMPEGEARQEMRDVRRERTRLLFVAPERFSDDEFVSEIKRTDVSLFVVDEAHCISEWGHDFRPSYLDLGRIAGVLGRPPIVALTATATPWVRSEIEDRLGMRDPVRIARGVDRPNLFLESIRVEREEEDYGVLRGLLRVERDVSAGSQLIDLEEAMRGSGIVYVRTTEAAEVTAAWLSEWGVKADFYHGRRRRADRERVQEQFMCGEIRVVAATNAFGLGIDKPDVRFVIHRDIPASLEAYYQEAGRAGRDGALARCALIYRPADLGRAAFLSRSGRVTRPDVAKVGDALRGSADLSYDDLETASGVGKGKLGQIIGYLTEEGIVSQRSGRLTLLRQEFDPREVSLAAEERRKAYEESRINMMRLYAETRDCRRRFILNYFGEEPEDSRCGRCDNDLEAESYEEAGGRQVGSLPFSVGDHVAHKKWGEGVVQRVSEREVIVLFQKAGYRTLDAGLVAEAGILQKRDEAA